MVLLRVWKFMNCSNQPVIIQSVIGFCFIFQTRNFVFDWICKIYDTLTGNNNGIIMSCRLRCPLGITPTKPAKWLVSPFWISLHRFFFLFPCPPRLVRRAFSFFLLLSLHTIKRAVSAIITKSQQFFFFCHLFSPIVLQIQSGKRRSFCFYRAGRFKNTTWIFWF